VKTHLQRQFTRKCHFKAKSSKNGIQLLPTKHKYQCKFRANSYTNAHVFLGHTFMNIHACKIFCYLSSHICISKAFSLNLHTFILKVFWAAKNYIHAYPRYFCYQKLHICISKIFLLPKHYILCIFSVFLLPKITYVHIQDSCYQKLHTHIFKYFCYLN